MIKSVAGRLPGCPGWPVAGAWLLRPVCGVIPSYFWILALSNMVQIGGWALPGGCPVGLGRLSGPEAVAGTVARSSDNFILTRQGSLGWELRALYFRVVLFVRSGPVGFFLKPF